VSQVRLSKRGHAEQIFQLANADNSALVGVGGTDSLLDGVDLCQW